jgi:hypothetical protein
VTQGVGPEFKPQYYKKKKKDITSGGVKGCTAQLSPHVVQLQREPSLQCTEVDNQSHIPPKAGSLVCHWLVPQVLMDEDRLHSPGIPKPEDSAVCTAFPLTLSHLSQARSAFPTSLQSQAQTETSPLKTQVTSGKVGVPSKKPSLIN